MRTLLLGLVVVGACAKKDAAPATTSNTAPSTTPTATPTAAPATNTPDKGGLDATAHLSPVHKVSQIEAKLELLEVNGKDVELRGKVTGLPAGTHALHYHNPMGCFPKDPHEDDKHLAELGTITGNASGEADIVLTIPNARLGGMEPITGNCLIIYGAEGKFLSYGKILGRGLFGH